MTDPALALTLGFDVSIRRTGWALLEYEDGRLLSAGTIEPTSMNLLERLSYLKRAVRSVLSSAAAQGLVDVGIEQGFQAPNGDVTRKLAMAWGVTALCCYERLGTEPHTPTPAEIKRLATGRGISTKEAMVAAAIERWDERLDDPDRADAAWVAEATRLQMQHYLEGQTNGE